MAKVKTKGTGGAKASSASSTKSMATEKSAAAKNAETKKSAPKKTPRIRYEVPHAPMGTAHVTVVVNGAGRQFTAKDKIIDLNPKDKELAQIRAAFEREGFAEKSFVELNEAERERQIKERNEWQKAEKVYTLIHPDATPSHEINANVAVSVNGESVQLDCKRNRVETDRLDVSEALRRNGFRLDHVRKKEG